MNLNFTKTCAAVLTLAAFSAPALAQDVTGAGATFPYGKDPQDSNIRIAPSLPPVEELEQAIQVLCACLRLSALEEYLK